MVLTLIGSIGTLTAFAADSSTKSSFSFSSGMIDVSCRLDSEASKIHLGGTIRHDVFVTHKDYSIEIYRIQPGQDASRVINDPGAVPIAGSDIAITFEFTLDAKSVLNKYSRYCVALRSPDGSHVLADEPKYAEISSTFSYDLDHRTTYKGIATTQVSSAANGGAGRVIIPIYFNLLLSATSDGYVYAIDGQNIYFNKSYVEALDVNVRSATAAGAEVYLQYMASSTDASAMPNTYDEVILRKLDAITSFLCERYKSFRSGCVKGIVVGREIDRYVPTDASAMASFAEKYALYVITVANVSRSMVPDMDIVLPFSSANGYTGSGGSCATLLETVLSILDKGFVERFVCTAMIESDVTPITYPLGWDDYQEALQPETRDDVLHAANVEEYAQYLDRIRARFQSTPESFMFVWHPDADLQGNALSAAYAYSYFRLIAEKRIAAFAISFADWEQKGNENGFSQLSHLFTYIDTQESAAVTKNLLGYFKIHAWSSIHSAPYDGSYALRNLYHATVTKSLPQDMKGSFAYVDFSTSPNLNTWFTGNGCKAIRFNYHNSRTKALQMDMLTGVGGYAEAFCLYDYPENLIYTPYVSLRVAVEPQGNAVENALYEVMIATGTGRTSIVGTTSVRAGEVATIVLDLSEFSSAYMSDYWRISVRPLGESTDSYSLWIYDIVGYSDQWTSEELADLIEAERLRIRNLDHSDDDNNQIKEMILTVLGIAGVILLIGVSSFIFLRSGEKERQNENESNNDNE